MELPSNMTSPSSARSICDTVIATFFSCPKRSVNCIRINWTSSSRIRRRISSLVYPSILRSFRPKAR